MVEECTVVRNGEPLKIDVTICFMWISGKFRGAYTIILSADYILCSLYDNPGSPKRSSPLTRLLHGKRTPCRSDPHSLHLKFNLNLDGVDVHATFSKEYTVNMYTILVSSTYDNQLSSSSQHIYYIRSLQIPSFYFSSSTSVPIQ